MSHTKVSKHIHTFKHLDFSQSLKTYSDSQLGQIQEFLLKDSICTLLYSKLKQNFCVEISVNSKEKYFRSKAFAPDIYVAVDLAIDKLEKQFLKTRKINQHHKKFELSKAGKLRTVNARFEIKPARGAKKAA